MVRCMSGRPWPSWWGAPAPAVTLARAEAAGRELLEKSGAPPLLPSRKRWGGSVGGRAEETAAA
eukprot:886906-Pyramimonas_sp.AAC.1